MNPEPIVRREAQTDLAEAFAWYEERRAGLGAALVLAVEATILQIRRMPRSFPLVHKDVRRALTKRFPYAVFFIEKDSAISIIAIFHMRRDPRIWQERAQ